MKFLLADDHAIMRDAYRLLLSEKYKKAKFGEASDTEGTIAAAFAQQWDLIILDLCMPGDGGMAALDVIHKQRPRLPVLVISTHDRRQYVLGAFRAGAVGYLTKASTGPDLVNACERILAGSLYVDAIAADYLAEAASIRRELACEKILSERELEVMHMIVSGRNVSESAGDLNLSINTYHTYRKRILKKLQVPNNAELMYGCIKKILGGGACPMAVS